MSQLRPRKKANIQLVATSGDGTVTFNIDKNQYVYYGIDSAFHKDLMKMSYKNPGAALNFCKRRASHYEKTL